LAETVKSVLRRTKLDPSRLYLEITESLLLEDTTHTREAIDELARLGVRFSLDDFGAGYSSLAYIRAYPFSKVKIDKTFIDDVDKDATSRAIIAAVSVLAARLDLEVVAEGVETQMQHVALRNLGLTQAQGYLYGKPAPQIVGAQLRLVASA
jgi:EAL domain-containing protein (putative c-di-GMP-specific phosphodiesterase class I)